MKCVTPRVMGTVMSNAWKRPVLMSGLALEIADVNNFFSIGRRDYVCFPCVVARHVHSSAHGF